MAGGDSLVEALRSCLLLALVNMVYYLRAVTEERHLSRDPIYREYRDWINRHGLLAALRGRLGLSGDFRHRRKRFDRP